MQDEIFQILRTVILEPCQSFETTGVSMHTYGGVVQLYGSIHAILGDHIGQTLLSGVGGPRSAHPSVYVVFTISLIFRYSDIDHNQCHELKTPERDPSQDYEDYITATSHPDVHHRASAKRALESRGLSHKRFSPLWELTIFRQQFYKHFALDYLHVALEGNWLRHFEYLGLKYGNQFCRGRSQA